jgi:antitoxin HigA-1
VLQFNPPHPGEILRNDYIEPLELTITELASNLGIARKNLSAIVNGHSGISPEMAVRLSIAFNTTPEFWINLQTNYDLWEVLKSPVSKKIKPLYKSNDFVVR